MEFFAIDSALKNTIISVDYPTYIIIALSEEICQFEKRAVDESREREQRKHAIAQQNRLTHNPDILGSQAFL